jgi:prevent-host-death family protein
MCYMDTATTVGVRELRQNLSVYLERVKHGTTYTVTEHGHVVAVLRPATRSDDAIERLIAEGIATPARRAIADLPKPLKSKRRVPLSKILDEMREDRI